jgi:hypothetical protein
MKPMYYMGRPEADVWDRALPFLLALALSILLAVVIVSI